MRGVALIAALLMLVACDPQPVGEAPVANQIAVPAPASAPAPAKPAPPLFNLASDGVQLVNPVNGSTRTFAFGTARADAVAAVQRALGPGTGGGPCPTAPLDSVRFDGIDLYFNQDALTGWAANRAGGDAALTTMAGIGIGTALPVLERAYAIEVAESTLGIEFTAGAIAGLLSSDAPTATITHLWAGETCIAR